MDKCAKFAPFLIIALLISLTAGCSGAGFNAAAPERANHDEDARPDDKVDFDDHDDDGFGDGPDQDGNLGDNEDEAPAGFNDLEDFLGSSCKSFNGTKKTMLTIPGGPTTEVDIRDYDIGGEIRDNQVNRKKTYVFHMQYYRLKKPGGGKEEYVRNIHDRDYDEVMYRALIDFDPNGFNLAESDCEVRAYELTDSELVNRFETRDNFDGGCFAATTAIRLADGTSKIIKDFTGNELVWNPILNKGFPVSRMIRGPERDAGLITLEVNGRQVRVTTKHPFESFDGLTTADSLGVGDLVLTADGSYRPISGYTIDAIDATQVVYNLTIGRGSTDPMAHMIMADGVVTGDLHLQHELGRKDGLGNRIAGRR